MKLAILLLGVISTVSYAEEKSALFGDPKLGNGEVVEVETDETRAVVKLMTRTDAGTLRGYCTGTLLNDTTLMTAVHCLRNFEDGGIYLEVAPGQVRRSLRAFYPNRAKELLTEVASLRGLLSAEQRASFEQDQSCLFNSRNVVALSLKLGELMGELPQHDVALVVFPRGTGEQITGGVGYYGVAETLPSLGTNTLFLGYGQSSTARVRGVDTCETRLVGDGFGAKRRGVNKLAFIGENYVSIDGYASTEAAAADGVTLAQQVSVRPGDSGGPWVQCSTANCQTFLVFAVNSTGSFRNRAIERSHGAVVTSSHVRRMFHEAVECDGDFCAANFVGSGVE